MIVAGASACDEALLPVPLFTQSQVTSEQPQPSTGNKKGRLKLQKKHDETAQETLDEILAHLESLNVKH